MSRIFIFLTMIQFSYYLQPSQSTNTNDTNEYNSTSKTMLKNYNRFLYYTNK